MTDDQRTIGGNNNKRGNRYEDYFATYKLLRAAHEHSHQTHLVRMREQAGCPVDDFVSQEGGKNFYYQLKADKSVTWGADSGKLEKEFSDQKRLCETAGENFQLAIVTNSEQRRMSFTKNIPSGLVSVTIVLLFPEVKRIKELLDVPALVTHMEGICALRYPRHSTYIEIMQFLYSSWIEHDPDSEGYCVLSEVLDSIRSRHLPLIACAWTERPSWWSDMEAALNRVANLEWWADRGYLEYRCGSDKGAYQSPCNSPEFERFAARLIARQPTDFQEFEKELKCETLLNTPTNL